MRKKFKSSFKSLFLLLCQKKYISEYQKIRLFCKRVQIQNSVISCNISPPPSFERFKFRHVFSTLEPQIGATIGTAAAGEPPAPGKSPIKFIHPSGAASSLSDRKPPPILGETHEIRVSAHVRAFEKVTKINFFGENFFFPAPARQASAGCLGGCPVAKSRLLTS